MKKICITIAPMLDKPSRMMPPYGILYLEGYLKKYGYQINIIDVDIYRYTYEEVINFIRSQNPFVIGISGIITPTYAYIIKISALLKENFPLKKIVIGSNVASAAEIILKNSKIDFIVHGEGEITFLELCEKIINNKTDFFNVKGISYIDTDGKYVETPKREPIKDLSILGFPNVNLLDFDKYLLPIEKFKSIFFHDKRVIKYLKENPSANKHVLGIEFSRGCTNSCTFCYRHFKGHRRFPVNYAVEWIDKLIKEYNFVFFSFADVNFNADYKWVYRFVNEIKKRKLKIFFCIVFAVVKNVTDALLKVLKEIGCVAIFYGFDSGSNRILSIMDKHASVDENIEVAKLMEKNDIKTRPFIVVGMPGETRETIDETINFLKKIGAAKKEIEIRYTLALPGTPLYEYDILTNRIVDEHAYLIMLGNRRAPEFRSEYSLNHTDMPDKEFNHLRQLIIKQVGGKSRVIKNNLKEILPMINHGEIFVLFKFLYRKVKNIYSGIFSINNGNRKDCTTFKEEYYSLGSLKNINNFIMENEKTFPVTK